MCGLIQKILREKLPMETTNTCVLPNIKEHSSNRLVTQRTLFVQHYSIIYFVLVHWSFTYANSLIWIKLYCCSKLLNSKWKEMYFGFSWSFYIKSCKYPMLYIYTKIGVHAQPNSKNIVCCFLVCCSEMKKNKKV